MPTWQIHSDAGNTFRWEMSDQQPSSGVLPPVPPLDSHCLPSMADLLRFQGSAKVMDNSNANSGSEKASIFLDGLGKPMAVKKSSIAKALSILQDEEGENGGESGTGFQNLMFHTGSDDAINQSKSAFLNSSGKAVNMSNSMFQTGSGKSVTISPAGLVRARKLLNLEETDPFQDFEQTNKLSASADDPFGWRNSFSLQRNKESNSDGVIPNSLHFSPKPHPIKFQTVGGRSISVSSDALQRAKGLLGDTEHSNFLDEKDAASPLFSFSDDRKPNSNLSIKKSKPCTPSYQCTRNSISSSSKFTSPLKSTLQKRPLSARLENMHPANNLIKHFDAVANDSASQSYNGIPRHQNHLQQRSNMLPMSYTEKDISSNPTPLGRSSIRVLTDISSNPTPLGRSSIRVLTDISNTISIEHTDSKQKSGGKSRLGRMSSVSPFKRPRVAKFTPPLNKTMPVIPNGMANLAPKGPSFKQRISDRYPFEVVRLYMKEYVGETPCFQTKLVNVGDQVRTMNPETAETYVFHDESGVGDLGIEALYRMLSHFGASEQYFSKVWVANHYKWIVWKLASYERCFPAKFSGKLLTFSNVLEELKYRYEREVNYGHRSAIKRILGGDAPPSSMLVLCISSIGPVCASKIRPQDPPILPVGVERTSKIELTDGWYSITALLDGVLSKMLAAKKLFLGQKLRIWGASLCDWVGPVSPLEVSKETSLVLHVNGTYRAHWADRLGFCKGRGVPLAFNSIKGSGGAVPITLVGISRIYPVLYRERLSNGGYMVRNEKMEAKAIHHYNQRRSIVAEGIASEIQNTNIDIFIGNDYESEEGAKLLKILEMAAEPDILMAEMTFEQLNSFSSYKAKLEAKKQSRTQKSLDTALEAAGLKTRDVTPFMRVRVVGLTSKSSRQGHPTRDGLITIWNPTEDQKVELTEGQAYAVSGLVALSSDSTTLHLQTRGSTTKWQPLSSSRIQHFWPFFSPRRPNSLSSLGEVHLSSEFDIVALVIYVGELHTIARQKKQWVFVTDGSQTALDNSLLAISFSSANTENESFAPEHSYPEGSVVCFCNLIKRDRDRTNHIWVAEGTENSTYHLSYDDPHCSHLKTSVSSLKNWVKTSGSGSRIEQLKGKVISIISNSVA